MGKFSKNSEPESLKLPLLTLYTKNGSIPFLTWNFINQFDGILYRNHEDGNRINLVRLNVGDFYDYIDNYDGKLSALEYFKNCSFILTLFDPLQIHHHHKSTDDQIAIETFSGKKMLSVDNILKLSHILGAKKIQAIADIITPPIAKNNWINRSVNRSAKFLNDIIQIIAENNHSMKLWATLTGGFIPAQRIRACHQISSHSDKIEAIVIDGFFGYNRSEDDEEHFDDIREILCRDILPNLPANIPKALFGVFYPDTMIKLIKCGIDIFDSSVCSMLTVRGQALPSPLIIHEQNYENPKLIFERFTKMIENSDYKKMMNDPNPSIIIDLNNIEYKDSNLLISDKCKCYTCNNGFTRSYINHLLKRREMNASILIQIHNHYVLTQFFHQLSSIIKQSNFDQLLVNSNLNI